MKAVSSTPIIKLKCFWNNVTYIQLICNVKLFLKNNRKYYQEKQSFQLQLWNWNILHSINYIRGFQLEFLNKSQVINHMTCYIFECSNWWKIYLKKNPLQDLLYSLNAVISTNERNWILKGQLIVKLHYNQIYLLKTTIDTLLYQSCC